MKEIEVNGRFVLNRSEGKVMGVAAGLADWTGIDVLLVRLGLVAALLLTGPVVILFYVLTGWLGADR
jgi:phage shock protein C